MRSPTSRLVRGLGCVCSLCSLLSLSLAGCNGDDQGSDELAVPDDVEGPCMAYCDKLAECNEETEVDECMEKCKGVLYACEEHEQDEANDQVRQCGEERDCLALPLCTVNAGIQCVTGLGL